MTGEAENAPPTRLWRRGGFAADAWRRVATGDDVPASGNLILPLGTYLGLDDSLRRDQAARLAVELLPADPLEPLRGWLRDLPMIALTFPVFSDGRAYSKASLLRRLGYAGCLRATGDVLIDQVALMLRLGFDELEITHAQTIARLETGRLGGIGLGYQPANAVEPAGPRYSWRRLPASPAGFRNDNAKPLDSRAD